MATIEPGLSANLREAEKLLAAGQLAPAEKLCRAVLAHNQDQPVALHMLGLISLRRRDLPKAENTLRRAASLAPKVPAVHAGLGHALFLKGDALGAVSAYRKSLALDGTRAEVHFSLGRALQALGRFDEALAALKSVLAKNPASAEAHTQIGAILIAKDAPSEALQWLERAAAANPDLADPHYYLGVAYDLLGRNEEALAALMRANVLQKSNVAVLKALVLSLRRLGRFDEAMRQCEAWAAAAPTDWGPAAAMSHVMIEAGKPELALSHAQRAQEMKPANADAHALIAHVFLELGETGKAISALERASELAGERPDIQIQLANVLSVAGRTEDALSLLKENLSRRSGDPWFYFKISELHRFERDDPLLAQMEFLHGEFGKKPGGAPASLFFALGKAYDDIGDYDRAFSMFAEGNARKRKQLPYDETRTLAHFDRLLEAFTPEAMALKKGGGASSHLPIFVLGLPRSGSTLVEQILASHPHIAAAGETLALSHACAEMVREHPEWPVFPLCLDAMTRENFTLLGEDYVRRLARFAKGASIVTDKLLTNALLVGLIHLALPNAKIVLCTRDPLDTCLSCFTKLFHEDMAFTYDLAGLGRYYRKHDALMAHWRKVLPEGAMFDIRYEDLIANAESETRRLLAYCGVEWDPACLDFHAVDRPVRTASVSQVREPLYSRSVGRWRRYRSHLGPLIDALGDLAEKG